jgi:hypothetical protein
VTLLQFFGLGGAIAVGGFIAGRWSNYRSRVPRPTWISCMVARAQDETSSVSPPAGNANMVEIDCTIKSRGLFLWW